MTTPDRCDRTYSHRPHTYVDDTGADHQCNGTSSAASLPELLAAKPKVAGIGQAVLVELEVMCA
ncbi:MULTISPECIES: hypothetical protein [unclassified Nocardioides]|uniref:hypothetical protein n=1 Tax=unclassified Nocardioides TaxID=2615069 RepID=UPI0009F06A68|nr:MULTISPECIES: hypothetical protein [unclassified Nocardioides]GAW50585.1 Mannose-6-phosphate isomerase, class I [Nocardioides sp. PD653-B2]GAW57470.1 Mannose-6-phosphate isomerase, class I [Nocardioides sp. PD653]